LPSFILEVHEGLPSLTTVRGEEKLRRYQNPAAFLMFCLFAQGFEETEAAELFTQWRGGGAEENLGRMKIFKRDNWFLIEELRRSGQEFSAGETSRMLGEIEPEAWSYLFLRRHDAPSYVTWVVTDKCGTRCIYCYIGQDIPGAYASKGQEPPSRDLILRRVREMHDLGCLELLLTGGDPFCRNDVLDIVEELIPLRWPTVRAITKCPLSPPQHERLRGIGRLGYSLDSLDDDIVEQLTGASGLATKILKSIADANERGIPVGVSVTATKLNAGGVVRLVEEVVRLGAVEVVVSPVVPFEPAERYARLGLSDEDNAHLCREVTEFGREVISSGVTVAYDYHTTEEQRRFVQSCFGQREEGGRTALSCSSGNTRMFIGYGGAGILCDRAPRAAAWGDVAEQSIREMWDANPLEAFFAGALKRDNCAEECAGCKYFGGCTYRTTCVADTIAHRGVHFGPPENCPCSFREFLEGQEAAHPPKGRALPTDVP